MIGLPPITKTVLTLGLVAWAIGSVKSGDPRTPDLVFVGSLAKQGAVASVNAAQKAWKLVPTTKPATAQQSAPQDPQPRSSAANFFRQPTVIEPAQLIPPSLVQSLGCNDMPGEAVPLNQQTLVAWLTRAGGYPRASLAALYEPLPGLSTPPVCLNADRTRAIWLVTFGGGQYQKLVAHFDPNQNYLRHDPLQPVTFP
jgi:hypothetical protein